MAKRTQVILVSDLSGEEIVDSGQTIEFGWKGTSYSIDLTDKEAEQFEKAIGTYLSAATKASRSSSGRRGSRSSGGKRDSHAIREWARAEGKQVPDRGRLPASIIEEYEAAH